MLRVGLIGLGNVAVAHLEGYRRLTQIKVVAGADVRAVRAAEIAERYGFVPYTDYRELLRREALDIVCVLSTVASHREVVEAVADRGVHILCEKPLAVKLEDADAMISRCRERGVKLFYAASYRFLPPVVKARELITEGRIGDVRLITEAFIGGHGPAGYQDMGVHHYPAGGPGGSGNGLVDHGIHLADIFPWLISSEIVGVYGRGQRSAETPIAEYMAMELKNGTVGHLIYDDATWSAELPSEGMFSWGPTWDDMAKGVGARAIWQDHPGNIRVYGTKGALRIHHYANKLFLRTATGIEQIPVAGDPMPAQFAAEMASFVGSIVTDQEPAVTGADGRRALAAVLGVYRSMETRQQVSLEG
ncbi:MAG: Gfo/Idh/MocA family oxidoreductase [Gemmatimonadota bacterium]